jgi:hypothetical protein
VAKFHPQKKLWSGQAFCAGMVIFCPVEFDSVPECKTTMQQQHNISVPERSSSPLSDLILCQNGRLLPC